MRRPGLPTVAGVLLAVFGLAVVYDAGIAGEFGLTENLTRFVGLVALAGAVLAARGPIQADQSRAESPTPETKVELPVPGGEIDDLLAQIDGDPLDHVEELAELRERLRAVAVAVFTDRFGLQESTARGKLETGLWTDNPHAAAFFVGEYPDWAPLRFQLRDRSSFIRHPPSMQAKHVAAELLAVATGEVEELDRAPARTRAGTVQEAAADPEAGSDGPATGADGPGIDRQQGGTR